MVQHSESKSPAKSTKSRKERWHQTISHHKSAYAASGATNELYFYNLPRSSLGQLTAAGTGQRGKLNNLWTGRTKRKFKETHYALLMVLENSGGFYKNETGFECPLAFGDFILRIPGYSHHIAQDLKETWSELCVDFEGTIFDILRKEKVLSIDYPVWHLKNPEPWILRIEELLHRPRPTNQLEVARETASFLTFLLEMLEAAIPKSASPAPNNWFNNACLMLSSDLSRPLNLKTVAKKLDMGYENFRVKFRREAGMAAGKYRDAERCKAACDHLMNTRKPCWEIALYLGFCDEQHFSRQFKKWTGMPPQMYRSKHTASKK